MCFDICTINIRVSIRVRGLHLVFFVVVQEFSEESFKISFDGFWVLNGLSH
jgi:hypothetical protein